MQVVLQSEVDMSQLKKTITELEGIVEKLERMNKEQEDSYLAQLDEARNALDESQERVCGACGALSAGIRVE